jgi:LysM repeat protein
MNRRFNEMEDVSKKSSVASPIVVIIVVLLHVLAIGGFIFLQGCDATTPKAEPPPAVVMPPRAEPSPKRSSKLPPPMFQPPAAKKKQAVSKKKDQYETYIIKKGDSLSEIAGQYGLSTRYLADLNAIKNPNKIIVGSKLLIPIDPSRPRQKKKSGWFARKKKKHPLQGNVYTVQKGDTLSHIAVRSNSTVKEIMEVNDMTNARIVIGQKIMLPGNKKIAAASKTNEKPKTAAEIVESEIPSLNEKKDELVVASSTTDTNIDEPLSFEYIVKEGETLDIISTYFLVSKKEIMELNDISSESEVKTGQAIKIPASE